MGESLYLRSAADIEYLLLREVYQRVGVLSALVGVVDYLLGGKDKAAHHVLIHNYLRVFRHRRDTRNGGHDTGQVFLRLLVGFKYALAHARLKHRYDIYPFAGDEHIQHNAVHSLVHRHIEVIRLEYRGKLRHSLAVHQHRAKHGLLRVEVIGNVYPG